ncbi:hypothetical protein K2X30_04815 [bacterium]|jgi:hypothetical protein|nr:hypothetical protein [bacterium]
MKKILNLGLFWLASLSLMNSALAGTCDVKVSQYPLNRTPSLEESAGGVYKKGLSLDECVNLAQNTINDYFGLLGGASASPYMVEGHYTFTDGANAVSATGTLSPK